MPALRSGGSPGVRAERSATGGGGGEGVERCDRGATRGAEASLAPHPRAEPGTRSAGRNARESIENRITDRITEFAGSMPFVYIHIAWFGC
jgi:hypothetical protein